jgi:hypothetical protein
MDNINVTVRSGTDLRGTVLVDGKPTPAAVRISLQADDAAAEGSLLAGILAQVRTFEPAINLDGSFTIPLVPDARYRFAVIPGAPQVITARATTTQNSVRAPQAGLTVLPSTAYLADVRQAGVSVYDNGLDVGSGGTAGTAPIEVLLSTNPGSLEGTVLGKDQKPVEGARVVLIPEMNRRQNPDLYKTARSDAQGRFTLIMLPPGPYKVFAWEALQGGAYQNAAYLEKVEQRGTPVTITAGSRSTASVRLITNE